MGDLFITHRDPLFGVIILVLLVATISLTSYMWNLHSHRRRENSLKKFSQLFSHSIDKDAKELLLNGAESSALLAILARGYYQSGDFEHAIKIYLSILENSSQISEKLQILEDLGEVYFMAGFLERSKKIFLEALKNAPRNPKALFWLMRVYEQLGQYEEALEALDCLMELGENDERVRLSHAYLSAKRILADSFMPLDKKRESLLLDLEREPRLLRIVLSYFRTFEVPLFWETLCRFDQAGKVQICEMIDMLWNIEKSEIPFALLAEDSEILDVYRARGYVSSKSDRVCAKFELEAVRIMGLYSKVHADLDFEYRCHACKMISPLEFERCPSCGELLSGNLILKIRKSRNEESNSFL